MKETKYIPGDLVMFKNPFEPSDTCVGIVKFLGNISDIILLCPYTNLNLEYFIKVENIQGIPITPEILEKNGWKKKVMSRGILNSHWVYTKPDIEEYGYFPIYIEKGIGKEFDVYPFTYNKSCTQITYIKYVHELQHLFFGLGINHEMEV